VAAVCNTSPLILYAKIGRLDIVRALFHEILIPDAVYREAVQQGHCRPDALAILIGLESGWIRVEHVADPSRASRLTTVLDAGEAEAIALAQECRLPVVLDDRAARRVAQRRHLTYIGSAGVAVRAKQQGLLTRAHPVLDALRAAGLRLDQATYRELLNQADE
jgi:uncharacterized protein